MTLQVHPIALGCMLVVAVGTLIYTYVTSRQQTPEHGYGGSRSRPYNVFEEPPPIGESRASSRSSLAEDGGPLSRRKKKHDSCSICLAPLKSTLKTLPCEHIFHAHCITMWLNSNTTCPLCRKVARN